MLEMLTWSLLILVSVLSAGHALLRKRDSRAALGWIVLCLAVPLGGAVLYWLFGVNRIRTGMETWRRPNASPSPLAPDVCAWSADLPESLPFRSENFLALLGLADAVTRRPLLPGNRVEPLHNGEQAYPAMLAAIDQAEKSICLSTYLFETNATGRSFIAALGRARQRGVTVRVLIDALGERYSFPTATGQLRRAGVEVARFLPLSLSARGCYFNLRNHRKLLLIDDRLGFTGGMNIGDRHLAKQLDNPQRVVDLHFRVEGPVVGQMLEAFWEDWHFTTGEGFPEPVLPPAGTGKAFCRAISAGPNEDFDKLTWLVIGALSCARRRVRIMTPYFIPDRALITALNAAALRGVEVDILLPAKNNLPFVAWASRSYLWELLQYGTRVAFQPAPFVHSKLLLVDDDYALIGSANLDPRSLRLNFEFNLEVYDQRLNTLLARHFDAALAAARPVTLSEMDGRSLPARLRDAAAKLFSPYL